MMEPFTPVVTDRELRDLRARLRATRWPEPETDPSQGVALADLRELCHYWADAYDWRACEERLGAVGQYRTTIDGLGIYFLHARSPQADALPLVLTHGWPGSIVEFLDALDLLTRAGFHCVVPSLPGYGWSDKPTRPGWDVYRIARAWATLMARLGYDRYGAQGSDWGTSVSASLGQQDPEHVVGIHLVPPLAPPRPGTAPSSDNLGDDESGYSEQQRTRPQTIGYSLIDSRPVLLVGSGEGAPGDRAVISRNSELDNLKFYWLPCTGASAARLYWESLGDVARWIRGRPRQRPRARPHRRSAFPHELQRPTRGDAEQRFTDLSLERAQRGGHSPPGSNLSCSQPRLKPFSGSSVSSSASGRPPKPERGRSFLP
jgi:pimeloyl-ACP methyl ester carboxylesterase